MAYVNLHVCTLCNLLLTVHISCITQLLEDQEEDRKVDMMLRKKTRQVGARTLEHVCTTEAMSVASILNGYVN